MNLTNRDEERLIAYHNQTLRAAAAAELKERIATDPDFRATVQEWEATWIVGMSVPDEIQAARAAKKDLLRQLEKSYETPPATTKWWPWLVAAALLSAGLMTWLSYNSTAPTPTKPENTTPTAGDEAEVVYAFESRYLEPLEYEFSDLGTEEEGISYYENGDYEQAWPLLLKNITTTADSLRFLYAGIAALETGNGTVAVAALQHLYDAPGFEFCQHHVYWYLALAQLQVGDEAAAEQLLRSIISNDWSRKEVAAELLNSR
ncbi:MAG: hypothetical protein AAGJ82_15085 [Bacteroidota bacterium]